MSKNGLMALAAFIAASAVATVSFGQAAHTPPAMPGQATAPEPVIMGLDDVRSFDQLVREHNLGLRREAGMRRAQVRRAQRLGNMIEEGRCQDAYRSAVRERDIEMAQKIADMCRKEP
ncbi:MAG: hypothetical protein P0Y50_09250 [Candidatus Brevundimonas colombiensis]|uniref:UrcA family protein n=1 Tax=Candidatus Brevundimonas colombiensis TaxID=3121376 RepID=A0AAJ6BJW2_9CAUL|nr:hypothetical protein [Brevundimonas sp.]WEK38737.1 MAG: hypothetical protein P0Y50_09250 [Brevundimonas sp.]